MSSLGNVHTLNLTDCKGITDVSSLGNVHILDLSGCERITDVSSLRNVHTLYLSEFEGISDMGSLGNVNEVLCPIPILYRYYRYEYSKKCEYSTKTYSIPYMIND